MPSRKSGEDRPAACAHAGSAFPQSARDATSMILRRICRAPVLRFTGRRRRRHFPLPRMNRRTQKGAKKRREVNLVSSPIQQSVLLVAITCSRGPITEVRAPAGLAGRRQFLRPPRVRRRCVFHKAINDVYTGSESRDERADAP